MTVRLQTARLVLRPPREQDVDAFAEAATDPEVMRFIGNGGVGTRDGSLQAIQRYIRFWGEDGFGMFAVECRDDGVVVGRTGLQAWEPVDWRTGSRTEIGAFAEIEIGWILARRHWGYGYATEAALAVREWALGELQLSRLGPRPLPALGRRGERRLNREDHGSHARPVSEGFDGTD